MSISAFAHAKPRDRMRRFIPWAIGAAVLVAIYIALKSAAT